MSSLRCPGSIVNPTRCDPRHDAVQSDGAIALVPDRPHHVTTSGIHDLHPSVTADLLAGVLDSSHDGIMAFRSRRDRAGQIIDFEWVVANPVARRIVGRESHELLGHGLLELMPEVARGGLFDRCVQVADTGQPFTADHYDNYGGVDRWFWTTAVQVDDGFAATFRDVTEQRHAHEALVHEKLHDTLTGLPNATLLDDRIEHALQGLERWPGHVGVVAVEVEPLNRVADALGHSASSELLAEVGRRLEHSARAGDTVARLVGHQFVVLCSHLDHASEAQAVAQRLAMAFVDPITIGTRGINVSALIGVATTETSAARPALLIRDADTAAHRARIDGQCQTPGVTTIDYFDEGLRVAATDRLTRQIELRQAIGDGELEVHYQTVHDAHHTGIVGLEALVRWQHPTKGLLLPGAFVPEAEELGLIVQLGDAVRRTALAHLGSWDLTPDIDPVAAVAVNASATELAMPAYAQRVIRDLQDANIEPHRLCVEVTETSLINDPIVAGATLRSLFEHGVKIALDDFGTGYSAIDFLRRFPVDIVKIDQSFTANIVKDRTDQTIVTAVLDLAHSLGKTTVAEGIETAEQLEIVTRLGADQIQGHHFAPALPYDQIAAKLAAQV